MPRVKCCSVDQSILTRFVLLCALLASVAGCDSEPKDVQKDTGGFDRIKQTGLLRWGADVSAAPYIYEDPANPGHYVGFEVDIAKAIAGYLGIQPQMVIVAWDSLIPELQRGTFDIAMNGIEDIENRHSIVAFSVPYFSYSQRITVRLENHDIRGLADLAGKRVGTLSGSAAEDLLRGIPSIKVIIVPEIIYSFSDLEQGKIDAVVIDMLAATTYGASNPKLKFVGEPFGSGNYVIAFRQQDKGLRLQIDSILAKMKENGELSEIYRKWQIMDAGQKAIGIR